MTRVLRENPSQIEPKYLVGNNLYTLKEKESLIEKGFNDRVLEILKGLTSKFVKESGDESHFVKPDGEVHLKDLLREHKGKLYVPEQVFGANLSEEEEFDKNVKDLPQMSYDDFQKCLKSDKVKLVSFKEDSGLGNYGLRDFVVDLKEIPGETSLHCTKWCVW